MPPAGVARVCQDCQREVSDALHTCPVLAAKTKLKRQVAAGRGNIIRGEDDDESEDDDDGSDAGGGSSSSSSSSSSVEVLATRPAPPPVLPPRRQQTGRPAPTPPPPPLRPFSPSSSSSSLPPPSRTQSSSSPALSLQRSGNNAPRAAAAAIASTRTNADPQRQAAAGAQGGGRLWRAGEGHRSNNCPGCGRYFERLTAHLSRSMLSTSCGKTEAGRAYLKSIGYKSRRRTADPSSLTAARGRAAAAPATPAHAVTHEIEVPRAEESPLESAKKAKDGEWPCPVCAKWFRRIGTHVQRSDCKKVLQWPPNTTVQCRRCSRAVGVTIELLRQHSKVCSIDDGATESLSSSSSSLSAPSPLPSSSAPRGLKWTYPSTSSIAGGVAPPSGGARQPRAVGGGKRRASSLAGGGGGAGGGSAVAAPGDRSLKRAGSNTSNGSAHSGGGGGGSAASPPLSGAAGRGGSFFGGRALGRIYSESSSIPDRAAAAGAATAFASGTGGGVGLGGGAGNGGWFGGSGLGQGAAPPLLGGGIIGAIRRPMPPMKRWETAFEAWAGSGAEEGGESAKNVEARYPALVSRAEDSSLVTVREVRTVEGAAGQRGGESRPEAEERQAVTAAVGGGGGHHNEAVVVCKMVTTRGMEGENNGEAGVRAEVTLGLEVADEVRGWAPHAGNGGGDDDGRLECFPVVVAVAAGGAADSAGVVAGARILKVEELLMKGKTAAVALRAMSNVLRTKTATATSKQRADSAAFVRIVIVTPPWLLPPPPPPPPQVEGIGKAGTAAGVGAACASATAATAAVASRPVYSGGGVGGMVCLERNELKGQEFVELCWSVLMAPGGGVPPPISVDLSAGAGERPAEQDADVARRLGFDVERRDLSQGMECIEVSSVSTGGLAAKHGLRPKDLLLAVDGKHLLSMTESSFWLEVGRTLRACDNVSRKQQNGTAVPFPPATAATAMATAATDYDHDGFPSDYEDTHWLRFLVFRKGVFVPNGTAPARTAASSLNGAAGDKRPVARTMEGRGPGRGAEAIDWRLPRQQHQSREPSGAGAIAAAVTAVAAGAGVSQAAAAASASLPGEEARAGKRKRHGQGQGLGQGQGGGSGTGRGTGTGASGGSSGGGGDGEQRRARSDRGEKRKRVEIRRRPPWWQPQVKGSHRTVLALRPADAVHGEARGGATVPPGAFLLEDAVLGDKMTIPAGTKLLSVDGRPTGDLEFEAARDVALSAGLKSVLVFGD